MRHVADDREVGQFQARGDQPHPHLRIQSGWPLLDDEPFYRVRVDGLEHRSPHDRARGLRPVLVGTAQFSPDSRQIAWLVSVAMVPLVRPGEIGRPRRLRSGSGIVT